MVPDGKPAGLGTWTESSAVRQHQGLARAIWEPILIRDSGGSQGSSLRLQDSPGLTGSVQPAAQLRILGAVWSPDAGGLNESEEGSSRLLPDLARIGASRSTHCGLSRHRASELAQSHCRAVPQNSLVTQSLAHWALQPLPQFPRITSFLSCHKPLCNWLLRTIQNNSNQEEMTMVRACSANHSRYQWNSRPRAPRNWSGTSVCSHLHPCPCT